MSNQFATAACIDCRYKEIDKSQLGRLFMFFVTFALNRPSLSTSNISKDMELS